MPGRSVAVCIWLLLLAACALVIARTSFRTDMGAFLPRSAPMAQQVLTEQVTSGAASHLILLGITGAPPPVLAALSEQLTVSLRRQPDFISVLNGDTASFADVQKFIWRNRYLLSADVTPARFTAAGLHAALLGDLGLLASDMSPMLQQTLPADPTNEILLLSHQLGGTNAPLSYDNVWMSADSKRALLLIHTAAPGFDIDAQQQALTFIRSDFAAIAGASGVRLLASGPGIFAIHTRDTTKRDVTWLSILATAGAAALLAFAYRSPLVILLGLLPVASGALVAIAAVSLAFGFVHGVTIGFGVTLIGESLDYAIYLLTQTARGDTAQDTLARIWPTLRLGVLTSAVGFCAMLASSFTGFAQLGLFSIAGLIVASGVTRFVLPRLLPQGFFAPGADFLAAPMAAVMAHQRGLRWLLAGALAAAIAALVLHRGGFWDDNLANLSPIPAADQALDATLRHDLAVPDTRFFVAFQATAEQPALRDSETLAATLNRLQNAQKIGGFDLPSAFLPSEAAQTSRRSALPDAATLAANLAAASAGSPFRAGTFAPFLRDAAAAQAAPLLTQAGLPPVLALRLETMLVRHGAGWVVMAPLRNVTDPAGVARAIAGAGASFVDLNYESDQLLHTFQSQARDLAGIGTLAILGVLLAGLRSVARVVTVAAPLAAAVVITAAVLTLGGGKISIFMVFGFLLIVAVGSNYCLFFERIGGNAERGRRAIASIVLANLCTVCAYGLMAISNIPVLHGIGITVAIGTFLSLVCAAVLSRPAAS